MNKSSANRGAILERLRAQSVDAAGLPDVDASQLTRFPDPLAKFTEMVSRVGGQAHAAAGPDDARRILEAIPEFAASTQVASAVPELVTGNVDCGQVQDPHELATLQWVILGGDFMVAENGAIWVDGTNLPHRAMLFVTQYLALVVQRDQIVHQMHEAYARIGRPKPGFGVFVAGPSKTADIEQSLVLGAHGCRSLHVFVIDS